MASPFDIRPDGPGNLRNESLNVILKFDRTGPGTGRVSWNVPAPAAGCTAETQAYCGMLIAIDTSPPTIQKIPTNGTIYSSDPTVDDNLFAGDSIGSAKVVGAFYQDRTTNFFDISGLGANTPYYVSGYPVDCQFNYYVEGVHAFSASFQGAPSQPTSGYQVLLLNPTNEQDGGARPTDETGLAPLVNYQFKFTLGVDTREAIPRVVGVFPTTKRTDYTVTINGSNAETYKDLINEINKQFSLLRNCPQSPLPPNTGVYYWNIQTQKLFLWDGYQLTNVDVLIQNFDPSIVVPGTYWYQPSVDILSIWNGGVWNTVTTIKYSTDPSQPRCDETFWFDGIVARMWNGIAWCEKTTHIQNTNPSLETQAPCGAYWYNTVNETLFKWNDKINIWIKTTAVQSSQDPNALAPGVYWFDLTSNAAYQWDTPGAGWNLIPPNLVRIAETQPPFPAPDTIWYNPTTEEMFARNIGNTAWIQADVISFPVDPTVRTSCDIWWDTSNDNLYVWDTTTNVWSVVTTFYQQDIDPTMPGTFQEGEVWYDPSTNKLYYWENNCFKQTEYVNYPANPISSLVVGDTVWFNTITKLWQVWNGTGWDPITPTVSEVDPTLLSMGTMWFNVTNNSLQQWNGVTWVSLMYFVISPVPTKGTCWFDTTDQKAKEWNGEKWVVAQPLALVEINGYGNLVFTDTIKGSGSGIVIEDINLFRNLSKPSSFREPIVGGDEISSIPSYREVGIGTDGSPDERYDIMNSIRYQLGYPTVNVELTPEQLDLCVTQALEFLRQQSSIAYKRGFFFLEIRSNTQKYLLTNKAVGYNKIVSVLGAYRVTSAFLSSAHGAGIYGQIVLQHLYNMGTFDLLSFHIMSEYINLLEILFAARLTYTWNEQKREIWLHQRFPFNERLVLLEVTVERTEQDIITDRWVRPWIRRYATAMARLKLAEIRGKFSSLPGAGGNITLNAAELRATANEDLLLCRQELEDYIVENPEEYGSGTQWVWG